MALTCDVTPADLGNVLESFLQIVHDQEDSAEGLQRLLDLDVEVRQQEKEKQTGEHR